MIQIANLSKSFGRLRVLSNIGLELEPGTSTALIGPNGSGKTTLIKCLLGLVIPDGGSVRIDGEEVISAWQYRSKIGYMPQIGRYPDNITIAQLFGMIRQIGKGNDTASDEELIRSFGLEAIGHKAMRSLSGGTRQKVSACLAFLFDPSILILDEPTAGLDPLSVEILKDKVRREQDKGKIILITSHILSDLEELTSNVILMNEGQIFFHKSIEALKAETACDNLSKAVARMMAEHNLHAA
jgi:Cu-processing system ATP-binding protein